MAGVIYPLFSKRTFDFSSLAASATQTYVMVKRVDVSNWTTITLLLRLHAKNINAEGLIGIKTQAVSMDVENPSVDFVDTSTSSLDMWSSSAVVPGLLRVDLSLLKGQFLQFLAVGTQANSPTTQTAVISAELVLKAKM